MMKATMNIDQGLLDNSDQFQNEFFNRFRLRAAPKPLQLNDEVSKDYLFPTFYGDVTCAMAVFMCDYKKAEALMPHPKVKPVKMTLGRSLVAFSCYEYKNVLGVAPYNEIAMTIPVMVDPGVNVPVIPMIADIFKNFGYYVFSMPVTSLENQIRGEKIWGLPKVVHEIDIYQEGKECVTVGRELDGSQYMKLRVPTTGKPTEFDVSSNLYTRLGDDFLQSETNFKSTFNMNKYMNLLWKKGVKPEKSWLEIGDTPTGQILKELQLEEHPFQFRYAEHMSSCFDLPNRNYKAPFSFNSGR